MAFEDLTGRKFSRLTVLEYCGKNKNRSSLWRCRCDCGREVILPKERLTRGHTRSCGCLAAEYRKNKPQAIEKAREANTKHAGSHERLFRTWTAMRNRCTNPRNPAYKWYGAKGVKVCDEWSTYEAFKEWAYANGYDENVKGHALSIDRINPNGDYCPENCHWADAKTQNENKTCVEVYEYKDERGTIGYFARKHGMLECTLRWRIKKMHEPIEKALTRGLWAKE